MYSFSCVPWPLIDACALTELLVLADTMGLFQWGKIPLHGFCREYTRLDYQLDGEIFLSYRGTQQQLPPMREGRWVTACLQNLLPGCFHPAEPAYWELLWPQHAVDTDTCLLFISKHFWLFQFMSIFPAILSAYLFSFHSIMLLWIFKWACKSFQGCYHSQITFDESKNASVSYSTVYLA